MGQPNNLVGHYECKLDAKGRLALPSALLNQLTASDQGLFVLNRQVFQPCMVMYPKSAWDTRMEKVGKLNRFVEANDRFLRQFMANATPIEPDGANRILLPKRLCEFANIDREVLIVSMVSDFEIWDPKTYQEMEQKQDRNEFLRLSELTMGDHPTNE